VPSSGGVLLTVQHSETCIDGDALDENYKFRTGEKIDHIWFYSKKIIKTESNNSSRFFYPTK
jgi:uncharacterized Fe-S cluster protein YjdI